MLPALAPKLHIFLAFCLFFFIFALPIKAQSSALDDVNDTISDDTLSVPDVAHSVNFSLPSAAGIINTTDWIHIQLPNFTSVTAATTIVGAFGGTPVFSASGTASKITGITFLPGTELTIEGLSATNPSANDLFLVRVAITEDEAGTIIKNVGLTFATTSNFLIRFSVIIANDVARLLIKGLTAPATLVTFTEGDAVTGTDLAGPSGAFSKLFPANVPGDHFINIFGVDTENRTTSVINLSLYTPIYQLTTVSNLLLSPTIEIDSTQVLQGNNLIASGSAYPGTSITLFTDAPVRSYTASTSAAGLWNYTITDTNTYSPGDYRIYAIAQTQTSIQSLFSPSLLFSIVTSVGGGTACGDISQGDLNCDAIVNLTDFSILMYYWGTTNAAADINTDGNVELTDFSIMMYYWGT